MQRNNEQEKGFFNSILSSAYHYFFSTPSQQPENPSIQNQQSLPKSKPIEAMLVEKKPRPPEKIILENKSEPTYYNQDALQKKMEIYFNKKMGNGYCNGLTFLWLYKMAEQQEHWFYALNEKIINCPNHQLSEIAMDIEKLYSHIEWAQNSNLYSLNAAGKAQINQRDLNKILEVEKIYSNKNNKSCSLTQLRTIFNKYVKDDVMISLGSPPDFDKKKDGHTIGVMQRKFKYYLYDGNYPNGRAKVFEMADFQKLYKEIQFSLYHNFNRSLSKSDMILEVDIGRLTRQKSQRLAEKRKFTEFNSDEVQRESLRPIRF